VTGLPAELPSGAYVRAVRADPKRRGLLFAATESGSTSRSTTVIIGSH